MGGDLLASFLKRRLESALGLDQSLEALVPALVCRTPFAFRATDILIIVLAFCVLEIGAIMSFVPSA
jgi:hypothetical protein